MSQFPSGGNTSADDDNNNNNMNNNQNNYGDNNSGNPMLNYYREWSNKIPFVTRYSIITITVIYILSWFLPLEPQQLGNVPYFTIFGFEVYRIITSPFVGNSIISLIMIFLFYPSMGHIMESTMGSSAFLSLMMTITVLTNLIFLALCFTFYLSGLVEGLFYSTSGFWTILFGLITIDCMRTPDQPRQLMFIPINIPSKYFPLLLYAFFALLSGFDLGNLIAVGLGYANSFGYLDRMRPTSYYLESLESPTGFLHSISRASGWVPAGATGHDAWIPVNSVDEDGSGHGRGGGASTSRGSGGGFPNIGGFGNWSKTDDTSNAGQQPETFPGSGRTLSSHGGAVTATPVLSSSSSFFSTSSQSSAAPAKASMSKEAIAARRLAALGIQSADATSQNPLQQRAKSNINDGALASLVEMGFDRNKAIQALEANNGDVDAAMHMLVNMQ